VHCHLFFLKEMGFRHQVHHVRGSKVIVQKENLDLSLCLGEVNEYLAVPVYPCLPFVKPNTAKKCKELN
jgi:hypothetical protein